MFVLTIFKDKQQPVYPSGNKDGRLFGISFGRLIRLFIFLTTGSSSSTPFSTPRQPLPPPLSLPPFSGTQPTYRSPQTSRRQVGSSIILSKLSRVLVWGRGLHLNTTSFLQACLHPYVSFLFCVFTWRHGLHFMLYRGVRHIWWVSFQELGFVSTAPSLQLLFSPSLRPVAMETLSFSFSYWVVRIRGCSGCFSCPLGSKYVSLPLTQTEKNPGKQWLLASFQT